MVMLNHLYPEVIRICRPLIIEDEILKLCVKKLTEYLEKSLKLEFAHRSVLKCKETYIVDFPDGSEFGSAIGLDISGKIFRLVHATFNGDRIYSVSSRLYEIPQTKLNGSGFKVIEYVARCVSNFIETCDIRQNKIILGVSIGFPIKQESLQDAQLLEWNDDFRCEDFIKEDFFLQLKLALKKFRGSKNMFLIAATNDAAASLLAGMYKDPSTKIGIVIGDQMNLCYLEKQDNISLFPGDGIRTRTAVDIDFRYFGDDGCLDFIKTEFDYQIDANSSEQGRCTMEKLISGQYIGEILRLCIIRMLKEKLILSGIIKPKLRVPGALNSSHIAEMEGENEKEFTRCKAILRKLGYQEPTDEDCCQIRFAARCIVKRSAHLLSAFLAAVVNHLDAREIRICADGSLLKRISEYGSYLLKKLKKLKRQENKCLLTVNDKEDLALGAAVLAFIYKDGVIRVEEKYRVLPPMKPICLQNPPGMPCKDCS